MKKKAPIGLKGLLRWEELLFLAARKGRVNFVKILLDNGARINARDDEGRTALHLASQEGHLRVVKLLLSRGAQINPRDVYGEFGGDGQTPLDLTTGHDKSVIKLLRRHGGKGRCLDNTTEWSSRIAV